MMTRLLLLAAMAGPGLAACGDDPVQAPPADPDLVVTGRLLDDVGEPIARGLIEGFLVGFPSAATGLASSVAPSCEDAVIPDNVAADGEAESVADGSFSVGMVGLDAARCLVVRVREPGQDAGGAVVLAPQVVAPGSSPPLTVSLGTIAIGQLDLRAR